MTFSQLSSKSIRARTVLLCLVLIAGLSLALAPHSRADSAGDKKKIDAAIAGLHTELEGTSQDLAKAILALERTKAGLALARQDLTAADAVQAGAERDNLRLSTESGVANREIAKATQALQQNGRDSEVINEQLTNLVRDDYQQGEISGLSIALQAASPQDLTDRIMMMDNSIRLRTATLHRLDVVRVQGESVRARLAAAGQQLVVLKIRAEASLAHAAAASRSASAARTRLDLLYSAQVRDRSAVANRKATEISNLARMRAQSDLMARRLAALAKAARERAAAEALQSAARAHDRAVARANPPPALGAREGAAGGANQSPSQGAGGANQSPWQGAGMANQPPAPATRGGFLSYPLDAPVSSEFGMRLDPVLGSVRLHSGIDFAADCGSPVYAAADGSVILATPESQSGGYGNQLVLDAGLQRGVDLTTTYNHLTRFVVTSGHVVRGQLVAYSGNTGFSTGCHLHFETRENGAPVNPRGWF